LEKGNENMALKRPWRKRLLLSLLLVIVIGLSIYIIIQVSLPDVRSLIKINPKTTALMEQRKEEANNTGKKIRISEDANFYFHEGIDLDELEESIKKNWQKGEFARGASTITQQLAKNLYLSTEKSILRKLKEFFITRELESILSKNRIFHLYLNIIEYGRGLFGVASASRYYFGKSVSELNDEEIIRLTAVIPKPLSVRPDRNSKWLLWRCRWITDKLLLYKYIEVTQHDSLIAIFSPPEP
jgi:monofunctional biosynthetic peptidoglycan transglycosylase